MAFRKPTDQNRVKFNSFADHIEPNFRRNFSLPSIEEGFVLRPTYFAIAQNLANELKAIQFLVVEDEFFALPDFDQRCFVFSQSCWCTIPHLAPSHWGFLSVDGHRSRRLIVGVVDGALLPLPPWFEDIVAPSTDAARGSDNEVEHPVLDEAGAATTSSTPTPRCDEMISSAVKGWRGQSFRLGTPVGNISLSSRIMRDCLPPAVAGSASGFSLWSQRLQSSL